MIQWSEEVDVPAARAASEQTRHHAVRWWVLGVLAIAQLMVVLDSTIITIALPHAQHDLGFSDADRQWVLGAYALSFGGLLLPGGRLADTFGRRRMFLIGVVGFALASAAGGAAVHFGMLVAARTIQGAFGAMLAPASLSLLSTTFTDADERGTAFAVFGGVAAAGASVGLLLGGGLTEYLSWRWTMYVNVPLAIPVVVGALRFFPAHGGEEREPFDRVGTALACGGLFALVYGCAHAAIGTGGSGWTDPLTIGFLVAGVVLLACFAVAERRVSNPLLPLRVFADRNRAGSYLAMFLGSIGLFAIFLFVSYYLENILHYSAVKAGLAFLPMTAFAMVMSGIATAVLLPRVSPRILIPGGLLVSAIGMILGTRITTHSSYLPTILPSLLLVAAGLGLEVAPAFSLGTLGVDGADAGVASAMVNISQQIGGSISAALLNSIATSSAAAFASTHAATAAFRAQADVHSFIVAFWVSAGVFVVAAILVTPLLRPGIADLSANQAAAGGIAEIDTALGGHGETPIPRHPWHHEPTAGRHEPTAARHVLTEPEPAQ